MSPTAYELHDNQTAVSKAERGKLKTGPATLGRLADALGVSTAWLRSGEGPGPVAEDQSGTRRVAAPPSVFADALEAAFDKSRGHRLADVDALRVLFAGESIPATTTPETLERAALRLLDAAASLRAEGDAITLPKVLLKTAS